MSVLTNKDILKRIKTGEIAITPPLDEFQLQPHSIDLRLGFTFLIPKRWRLTKAGRVSLYTDPMQPDPGPDFFDVVELEQGQYFELLPDEHVLVSSLESIKMPVDLMAVLYPRSSVNRKGLSVDLTGIIDAGYEGVLTIPIKNNTASQVIKIYPGERFCQLVFEVLSCPATVRKSRWHLKDVVERGEAEKQDEIDLIIKGDIKNLKEKFAVKSEE